LLIAGVIRKMGAALIRCDDLSEEDSMSSTKTTKKSGKTVAAAGKRVAGTGKGVARSGKGVAGSGKNSKGFTHEERAAMKERARELKAEARANRNRAEGESDLLAKIAEMREPDRSMATRLHAIIKASAPTLSPKTWYGMPAYANQDGKVVCFFQSAQKFNARYATFGFNDAAKLDDGALWPTAFAMKELTAAGEAKISKLVKKAVS
jgi:uncharacterized protein YdhG (YjbR/CyaY superfamily)